MDNRSIYRDSLKYSFQTIKSVPNMIFYVIINSPINKNLTRSALAVVSIKLFEKEDIPKVIEFEYELRK